MKPAKELVITKPVLSLHCCDEQGKDKHKIQLWVGDAGQTVKVSELNCHWFPCGKTASLVYEEQHHMHSATELPINNPSTWRWIGKWMERGLIAEGYMSIDDSQHWHSESGKIRANDGPVN